MYKLCLISLLFFITIQLTAQDIFLEEGLISYYPFTKDASDAMDRNNGTVYNASLELESRCGDNAYFFNGGDAYIDCGTDKSLNYNFSSFSVAVWVRPSAIVHNELSTIVAKWGFTETRDQFGLWINATYKVIAAFSAPGTMEEGVFSQGSIEPDKWYHIVTTWKRNGEIKIFINGKLDKIGHQNGRGLNTRSDLSMKIGRQLVRKNRPYKGYIDELRIYGRSLSDSEVSSLYNNGRIQCEKITLKGVVYNKRDRIPLRADVIVEDMEDGTIVATAESANDGSYEIYLPIGGKYAFYAKKENFLSENRNIDTEKYESNATITRDLFLVPVEVGETLTLNNIFFDFNKATLQKESFAELNRTLPFFKQYPNLKIELAGHTDAVGSDDYNQKLSEERANSVRNYLLSQGVPEINIVAQGYGEAEPVATNETDEGRQENRRVEFRIIGK